MIASILIKLVLMIWMCICARIFRQFLLEGQSRVMKYVLPFVLRNPEIIRAQIADVQLGDVLGNACSYKSKSIWIKWMV